MLTPELRLFDISIKINPEPLMPFNHVLYNKK